MDLQAWEVHVFDQLTAGLGDESGVRPTIHSGSATPRQIAEAASLVLAGFGTAVFAAIQVDLFLERLERFVPSLLFSTFGG